MIGYVRRPDKEKQTKRKVTKAGKRKATQISRTPFKAKTWKKG